MYSDEDCLATLQLTAWVLGKSVDEITVGEYRSMGWSPTYQTVTNRLGGWNEAKQQAAADPQYIPSHLDQYYRSVAALRRARDLHGYPVTGLEYQTDYDIEVSYHDVLAPFSSWTQAKRVAGIHNKDQQNF
jgi:hypothetical protein